MHHKTTTIIRLLLLVNASFVCYVLGQNTFLVISGLVLPLVWVGSGRLLPNQNNQLDSKCSHFALAVAAWLFIPHAWLLDQCRTFTCAFRIEFLLALPYACAVAIVPFFCINLPCGRLCDGKPTRKTLGLMMLLLFLLFPPLAVHRFHAWACFPLNILRSGTGPVLENFVAMASDLGYGGGFWLERGALLSVARTGRLTPWDTDIDLYMTADLFDHVFTMDPQEMISKYDLKKTRYCHAENDAHSCKLALPTADEFMRSPSGYIHLVWTSPTNDKSSQTIPCEIKCGGYHPVLVNCPLPQLTLKLIAKLGGPDSSFTDCAACKVYTVPGRGSLDYANQNADGSCKNCISTSGWCGLGDAWCSGNDCRPCTAPAPPAGHLDVKKVSPLDGAKAVVRTPVFDQFESISASVSSLLGFEVSTSFVTGFCVDTHIEGYHTYSTKRFEEQMKGDLSAFRYDWKPKS